MCVLIKRGLLTIMQFLPEPELVVNIDGKETKEKGILFTEATFISALK